MRTSKSYIKSNLSLSIQEVLNQGQLVFLNTVMKITRGTLADIKLNVFSQINKTDQTRALHNTITLRYRTYIRGVRTTHDIQITSGKIKE